MSRRRHISASLLPCAILALGALVLSSGCDTSSAGESCDGVGVDEVCGYTYAGGDGNCVCGNICQGASDCPSGEACQAKRYDDHGVCVPDSILKGNERDGQGDGGGGGNGRRDPSCADDEIEVKDLGCRARCSSDSDCSSDCCAPLDSGESVCTPASYCDGGGGSSTGGDCPARSECLDLVEYGDQVSYCKINNKGEVDAIPVMENSCGEAIECKICGSRGGVESSCSSRWTFDPGQRRGGWGTFIVFCDIDEVVWWCTSRSASFSCLESVP